MNIAKRDRMVATIVLSLIGYAHPGNASSIAHTSSLQPGLFQQVGERAGASACILGAQTRIVATDAAAGDRFGVSVSASNDVVVVGSAGDLENRLLTRGVAHVYIRSQGKWVHRQKLVAADGALGDAFGASVSVSDDTILVGAPGDDEADIVGVGSVYVFSRVGDAWISQGKIQSSDGWAGDWFGRAVAIVGDTAIVGAPFADIGNIVDQGAAYVLARSGSVWNEVGKLTSGTARYYIEFGNAVAISGDTVVVGARYDGLGREGAAYVFSRGGQSWSRQARLVAGDAGVAHYLGWSVAVHGDTAMVGSLGTNVGAGRGSVYVFNRSGTEWVQAAKLQASDGAYGDFFGASVYASADLAVVGAPQAGDGLNESQGAAYLFTRTGGGWVESLKLMTGEGAAGDQFGGAVSASIGTILIGGVGVDGKEEQDQGAAYAVARGEILVNGFENQFGEPACDID